jgi:glyoxylase-like metal-dependent hydrolase (beta-lactamase superfamily II)
MQGTHFSKTTATALLSAVLASACGSYAPARSPAPPPLTRDRELESLEQAVRFRDPDQRVVMTLAGAYLGGGRVRAGYDYFAARAKESPDRPLFLALEGLFQARLAPEVPLLQRKRWAVDAVNKLDRAAAQGGLPRYLRGLVLAELPASFGRAPQAAQDLEWMLANAAQFPPGLQRGAWSGLSKAYAALGRPADAERARANAGGPRQAEAPLLTDSSVTAADGLRMGPKQLIEVVPGRVFVASGYDFADLAFVVTDEGIAAIDAGTTEPSATQAVAALRARTSAPIRWVLVTHAHWDHIGGLRALAGPGVEVIAQARFPEELSKVNDAARIPFKYFFGANARGPYALKPQRLVDHPETISLGGTRFALHPVHGGETDDALLVELPDDGVVFVGDVFMPYLGAPFVAEGSVQGLIDAIGTIRALHPRTLIHGHQPLTQNFTVEVLAPLQAALSSLQETVLAQLREQRTLPEILETNPLPEVLAAHPQAVLPFLLMRDNVVKRLYQQRTGYWKADGEGMEVFTRAEWGKAADLLAGGAEEPFVRAASSLNDRGDFGMALQLARLGIAAHPKSGELAAQQRRALDGLRARHQFNPFKFIIYSEQNGEELPPLPELTPSRSARAGPAPRP